jgi:phosphate acetyltransferase
MMILGLAISSLGGLIHATSSASARSKRILSAAAGDTDILVVAGLDVGNALYKSFVYIGRGERAGVMLGAKVPVIVTSRADTRRARLHARIYWRRRH